MKRFQSFGFIMHEDNSSDAFQSLCGFRIPVIRDKGVFLHTDPTLNNAYLVSMVIFVVTTILEKNMPPQKMMWREDFE